MNTISILTAALLLLLPIVPADAQSQIQIQTQTFSLAAQWNLVTFQVTPTNPDPAVVFATLPGFQSAWTYDSASGLWLRYVKPTGSAQQQGNDSVANALLDLPPIEPGTAYWIQMANAVAAWTVPGVPPRGPAFPSLTLNPGWNLIGIPVGSATVSNSEPVSLLAVLTAAGFDYDALLTWENQGYRKMFRPQGDSTELATNVLAGLPPDPPFPAFDLQRDLGRGYWVHVLDPAVIRPQLLATVRPDFDAEPLNNFPSREDLNVSGVSAGNSPRTVASQDVIRFFPGEDIQTLGLANAPAADGGGGGGILLWEAVWLPSTDHDTPEPWIRLFASPDQRELRDEGGHLTQAYSNLNGVTTLENDIVYLRLDRKNLGRGRHEGQLLLRTSVGDRSFHVIADVSGIEGDFKGYAHIASVNGRHNPVPDVDLNLSLYEDLRVTGMLRGLIDSSQALLWPVDVPLVGNRISDVGNQFIIGGAFVLPPGDQNGEPYDRWDENDPSAGRDVDWLNDGRLDARNPFPFPIQRTVSLDGMLVKGNPTDGYVLEGAYNEIVYGMSRQPILLEGTFHLERQSARPLSSRRSITTDTGVEPVVSRKSAVGVAVPAGATRESGLAVVTEMDLQALQVDLVFANAPHSRLLIQLRSPGPNPALLTIYDGRSAAAAINPKLLAHVVFPLDRPTQGDLDSFIRSVTHTRTDPAQLWTLTILNAGSQTVTLGNWSLRLDGQPVTDVVGVVANESGPMAGAVVSLNGVPFSLSSAPTGPDGRFVLSRVPLLPLNFSASRPGYLPLDPADPGLGADFTRPFVGQAGLTFTAVESALIQRFNALPGAPPAGAGVPGFTAGTTNRPFELEMRSESNGPPQIVAGPRWLTAGSTVDFVALHGAASVAWDFGDGQSAATTVANHVYNTPGLYHARLFSPASQTSPADAVDIVVMPAPGRAPARPSALGGEPNGLPPATAGAAYSAFVFQPVFTFAGVLPAHQVGIDSTTGADRYVSDVTPQSTFAAGETNQFGAAIVPTLPLQHAYAGSSDLDLAPHTAPPNTSRPFASDGFTALSAPGFNASINSNAQGFREEDFNYAHLAPLWQNTRAADGTLEYPQDPVNGLILWGNTLVDPSLNYSTQTLAARDGTDYSLALDDTTFHPHPGTTTWPDLAPFPTVAHLRVTCSLGAPILAAPTPGSAVAAAKLRRSDPDNTLADALSTAPGPVPRNLEYRFLTGVLATP